VIFTQFVDDALGCASYVVGDPGTGEAVVVDPAFAIEQYLEEAGRREVRIVRVIETHTHADHLSGHGRFALELGVPVSIHPAAEVEYAHDPMQDGAEIAPGDILHISVWKEPLLRESVFVRLDGKVTVPLIGDVVAGMLAVVVNQAPPVEPAKFCRSIRPKTLFCSMYGKMRDDADQAFVVVTPAPFHV